MIKLKSLLMESGVYPYGCVMLYFEFPQMGELQSHIMESDLGEEGLETEPHITLLYGLHDGVELRDVSQRLSPILFGHCRIHNPSLFENEKFDVLKFDVGYIHKGGAFLHNANRMLNTLPNTQTYPHYHPHMTVAYLKPGMGKKYVDRFGDGISAWEIKPTYGVFSQPSGVKTRFEIKTI